MTDASKNPESDIKNISKSAWSDEQLDHLLRDAAHTWHVPPAAPLDALWVNIERDVFSAPVVRMRRAPGWTAVGFAAAASLVVGVLSSQLFMRNAVIAPQQAASIGKISVAQVASNPGDPTERLTEELLGRTALLLATLPATGGSASGSSKLAEQAGHLLTTTRLLMDSPLGQQRRMKELLQDLELVLAQVTRLRAPRHGQELTIIKEAVEDRELVPRIRSAVADLAGGGE